jgi:N-acetylglucosamine-6-phosphate deacetylase
MIAAAMLNNESDARPLSEQRWALAGGEIITPLRRLPDGVVAGTGAQIDFVVTEAEAGRLDGYTVRDVRGLIVAPGFVDIHLHGGGGVDFLDGSLDAFDTACQLHVRHGTTALLPTTVAVPIDKIIGTARLAEQAMRRQGPGAQVLGLHVEGPWFAEDKKGAHDRVWPPREAEWRALLPWAHVIRRLTLAPELPGALEAMRALAAAGILVCAGHTNASYDDMLAAMELGLSHVTHLWNQSSIVFRSGPYRHGGCVEAALLEDSLSVELIADGHHLPPELMRLAVKCKGLDRLCLVTDAMRGAGMAQGTTWAVGPLDSKVRGVVRGGVATLPDNSAFAGSIATMDRLLRNAVELIGLPLADALRVITLTPARIVGVHRRKGSLAPGKDADLVLLDRELDVVETIAMGRTVYRRDEGQPVSEA